MRKIRVYLDASVFGGTRDEEFAQPSRLFFDRVRRGEFVMLLSPGTMRELASAPQEVLSDSRGFAPECMEEVPLNDEVRDLAAEYVRAGVLGESSRSDAVHVAAATVAGADLILSWNFRHLVNFNRIRGFNGVNVALGYRTMTILSPLEVAYEDQDQDV